MNFARWALKLVGMQIGGEKHKEVAMCDPGKRKVTAL